MKNLRVGMRVRILWSLGWPELAGQTGVIVAKATDAGIQGGSEWDVAPDLWGDCISKTPSKITGLIGIFGPCSDQLEPLYDGDQASSWEQCLWRPNVREGASRMNLRDYARNQQCQIRLPGCLWGGETVVLCHYSLAGISGRGLKSPDILGAHGCASCHRIVDGQGIDGWSREQIRLAFAEGVFRTIALLLSEGVIVIQKPRRHGVGN